MLPVFIRVISSLLPTTPFMRVYISVTQQGGTLMDNVATVFHMLALMILFTGLSFHRFRWLAGRLS
jgi:ABC-2 type transport system permease protein